MTGLTELPLVLAARIAYSNKGSRGPGVIVPTFHRFGLPWVSLGLPMVSQGLSGELLAWYQCSEELVVW